MRHNLPGRRPAGPTRRRLYRGKRQPGWEAEVGGESAGSRGQVISCRRSRGFFAVTPDPTDMAEATGTAVGGGAASSTVTTENEAQPEPRSLTIKLRKRKPDKKVEWTCDTVDNENLGRRSSKCCCIYEKPRAFGESSTESDDDDECCESAHCIRGHKKRTPGGQETPPPSHESAGSMQH